MATPKNGDSSPAVVNSIIPIGATTAENQLHYRPIQEMELGQRTLGLIPLRKEVPEDLHDPDPQFWREVHLEVTDDFDVPPLTESKA